MTHNNLYTTLNISYDLESLEDIQINVNLKGFILNYNSENYIITLHKYYPIQNIKIENLNYLKKSDICQSSWNELLIIKNTFEDSNYNKIKNIKTMLPQINQELYCNDNKLIVIDHCYENINHLPLYPRLLYIKVKSDDTHCTGMPVFQKDGKLVGIISDTYSKNTYIIPTYYIIKTLQKKCNDKIFTINNGNITKINKFNVINNDVYHRLMSIKIPLDVYFTLEGDENKIINLNKNEEYRYVELENIMISNERNLLKENRNYIVNATLLIILKVINNRIMDNFINFIQLNFTNKILLNIRKKDAINDIKQSSMDSTIPIEINGTLYEFTMFV